MQDTSDDRVAHGGIERLFDRLGGFVRSRDKDHWLMFVAGLLLGVLIG